MSLFERFRGGPSPEEERAAFVLELEAAELALENAKLIIAEHGKMRDSSRGQDPGGRGADQARLTTLEEQVGIIEGKISKHDTENPPFGGALKPYEVGKTRSSETVTTQEEGPTDEGGPEKQKDKAA